MFDARVPCEAGVALVIALLAACLSIGCGAQPSDGGLNESAGSAVPADSAPFVSQRALELSNGRSMRYTLSLPATHDANRAAPMILALHYGGPVTPYYGRGMIEMLVGPALGELNAIIVAPDSIAGRWNNDANERAVLELIDHLKTEFKIAENQTLVTGFSMGGAGTWYFASRHQDLFSAAIPIAGRPLNDGDQVEWKIPLYVIHSRADTVVPLKPTQQAVEALREKDVEVEFVIVEGLDHFDTPRFAEPLRDAAPWIRNVWSRTSSDR
ncbi:MAG: prolyl oligopeptidase family serine peptidase [Pirellulaceae bacterium]|jgi:predicted peptidase|nr:prolyl oligopeptidase family serine peptidase [Pirellulaceae bacterium]MDP7015821.1 prolyl oligopeptidase family serine peptidase [Pirellulaceae bacterium]